MKKGEITYRYPNGDNVVLRWSCDVPGIGGEMISLWQTVFPHDSLRSRRDIILMPRAAFDEIAAAINQEEQEVP